MDQTYWAFISYSHLDDTDSGRRWASWLHQAIEQYEVPTDLVGTTNKLGDTIPERIYPVFNDKAELSVSANLTQQLRDSLEQSRHLIVICSPRSLSSRHVSNEVTYFKTLGHSENIAALIVDGRPNASKSAEPDHWNDECFVPPLLYKVDSDGKLTAEPEEPLAADMRIGREQGWTTAQDYQNHLENQQPRLRPDEIERMVADYRITLEIGLLKIIAQILGVPLRELTERDKAYQLQKARKRARAVAKIAAFMSLLALAAVTAGGIAVKNQYLARIAEGKALLNQATSHDTAREFPQAQIVAARALGFSQFNGEPPDNNYSESLIPNRGIYTGLVQKLYRIASGRAGALSPVPVWCSSPVPLPENHTENPVWTVEFSPDYQWVASGSEDGKVRLFSWTDPSNHQLLNAPGPPHQAIRDMKISPDGQWLAVAYESPPKKPDFFVIWKVISNQTGIPTFSLHRNIIYDRIVALDWSPDSSRLVTAGGPTYVKGTAAIWQRDSTDDVPLAEEIFPGRWIFDVGWSPSGETIALAGNKQTILIDPTTAKQVGEPLIAFDDDTACTSLSFGGSGKYLATGTTARKIYIWERSESGYQLKSQKDAHDYAVRAVKFSPDGEKLFTTSTIGLIRLWNTSNLQQLSLHGTLLGDSSAPTDKFPAIRAIKTSPDGKFLLTGMIDGTMRLWWLGNRESRILENDGNVECVASTPDVPLLAIAREIPSENTGVFSVFDLEGEETLWTKKVKIPKRNGFAMRLKTHLIHGGERMLTFHRPVLNSADENYISLYETRTGRLIDSTALPEGILPRAAAFSQNSNRILLATATAECYSAEFDHHSDSLPRPEEFIRVTGANEGLQNIEVWDLAASKDGTLGAVAGRHKKDNERLSYVHFLDLVEHQVTVKTDVGPNVAICIDFHPDGSQLAVGTFERRLIYVVNSATGEIEGKPLRGHGRGVTAVSYSPSGTALASGSSLKIRVWDMQSRDEIAGLFAHEKMVQSLAWAPSLLVSGAEEPSMKLWWIEKPNLNLKAYFDGPAPWLVFNPEDGALSWNTRKTPHGGLINLPDSTTIGRVHEASGSEDTLWNLYLGSIQADNWDSAAILYERLTETQRDRNSLIINQSARRNLMELDRLSEYNSPPDAYIERRRAQIQRLIGR